MAIGKGVKNPSYQNRVAYHSTLLGGVALLVTSILVLGDIYTREAIAKRLEEDTVALIGQVIPAAIHDNNIVQSVKFIEREPAAGKKAELKIYQAMAAEKVVAVAYEVEGKGYAGPIKVIMGIDKNGTLLGVRVISHMETPGLGDKIEESKSDWILDFNGLSFASLLKDKWKVRKDGGQFDQFSGATITPRAVVKAITQGLDTFHDLKEKMLSPPQQMQAAPDGNDSMPGHPEQNSSNSG